METSKKKKTTTNESVTLNFNSAIKTFIFSDLVGILTYENLTKNVVDQLNKPLNFSDVRCMWGVRNAKFYKFTIMFHGISQNNRPLKTKNVYNVISREYTFSLIIRSLKHFSGMFLVLLSNETRDMKRYYEM